MLSDRSTATVRATLPAVGAAIGDIADLFYKKLFTAHPELLRDLFNRGNQASGDQRKALAGSIAAFATALVEHPGTRPDVMLNRIAHKHASLGVIPEQYEVVHTHLFAAIADVLGDAVTPEVAAAWDEVYWLMANALISMEARLYAQQGVVAGDVWREWEVAARIEETGDVTTFRLRPADGGDTPAFRPGQYVSVQVELADGARQIRQYSLSSSPGSRLRSITVKRVRGEETPRARSPATSTSTPARATGCASPPPTGTWSSTTWTRPSCWPRPESAARPCCRCWSTWPRRATTAPSPSCTATAPRRPRPARPPHPADGEAPGGRAALLVRVPGSRPSGPPHRPRRPERHHRPPRNPRLPLRPAPLHAHDPHPAAGRRGPPRRHPLRGLRPRPLAGGRLTSPGPGRATMTR